MVNALACGRCRDQCSDSQRAIKLEKWSELSQSEIDFFLGMTPWPTEASLIPQVPKLTKRFCNALREFNSEELNPTSNMLFSLFGVDS